MAQHQFTRLLRHFIPRNESKRSAGCGKDASPQATHVLEFLSLRASAATRGNPVSSVALHILLVGAQNLLTGWGEIGYNLHDMNCRARGFCVSGNKNTHRESSKNND